MIQKRNVWITFMFTALTLCLCGCTTPGSIQTKTPSATPAVSGAATPTPSNRQPEGTIQGSTQTRDDTTSMSVPTTDTPTPTPSPSPSPTPTPIPSVPAAPVAVNTDTTTDTFLINRDYPLTSAYVPTDLVAPDIPFSFNDQTLDKRKLRLVAAEALEELYQTALSEEGLSIYGVSGYRSYDRQYDIYGKNLILKGTRHTNLYSAAPGNSEHQTGLAIDVSCESIG